jgi:hypothetical protein
MDSAAALFGTDHATQFHLDIVPRYSIASCWLLSVACNLGLTPGHTDVLLSYV